MSIAINLPAAPFGKDPGAVWKRTFDWSKHCTNIGATITASTWTVDGPDGSLTASSGSFGATSTGIFISGGTVGATYRVTNRVTFADASIEERTIEIYILNQ